MPTAGTHITIVQRLALDPELQPLLGNPDPDIDPNSEAARLMRFANLGAVGPDLFYALGDFDQPFAADGQAFINFLVQVGGTFACISEFSERISNLTNSAASEITLGVVDSLHETFDLILGTIKNGILAATIKSFNFFALLEPPRQKDLPREKWFWADYLHYVRTGEFVEKLLEKSKGNPMLRAYALGYLTHYVTDVVGHPYVNQVTQSSFRLYWQRHHLVENFIDAYVWDRWHQPSPEPEGITAKDQPLDRVTSKPNTMGTGAPFTFSRLHDLIFIGDPTLGDPLDGLVGKVCEKIKAGAFDLGIAEDMNVPVPDEADFNAWTQMMAEALKEVYKGRRPRNLEAGILGASRPGGYPFQVDIASAYGAMRFLLKLATEEKIRQPQPPDIAGSVAKEFKELINNLKENISEFGPPPKLGTGGSFNPKSFWKSMKKWANYIYETAKQVAETIIDFIKDALETAGAAAAGIIKMALYLLNSLLFGIYRSLRDILMLNGYVIPYTEQLTMSMFGPFDVPFGDIVLEPANTPITDALMPLIEAAGLETFNTVWLWCSLGGAPGGLDMNLDPEAGAVAPAVILRRFPIEELESQNDVAPNHYVPFQPPVMQTTLVEHPNIPFVAPYGRVLDADGSTIHTLAVPDHFIDGMPKNGNPFKQADLFDPASMAKLKKGTDLDNPSTFESPRHHFGGAMANCRNMIMTIARGESGTPVKLTFPDYNLDGDRGWAWPCWDVDPIIPADAPTDRSDPAFASAVQVPLHPDDPRNKANGGVARVNVGPAKD